MSSKENKKPLLEKITMMKEALNNGIDSNTKIAEKLAEEKVEYRESISKSNEKEFDLLMKNLEKADTEEERQAIREQAREIRESEREEAKDYDQHALDILVEHGSQILKGMLLFALSAGLIKNSKSLADAGKNVLKLMQHNNEV